MALYIWKNTVTCSFYIHNTHLLVLLKFSIATSFCNTLTWYNTFYSIFDVALCCYCIYVVYSVHNNHNGRWLALILNKSFFIVPTLNKVLLFLLLLVLLPLVASACHGVVTMNGRRVFVYVYFVMLNHFEETYIYIYIYILILHHVQTLKCFRKS